MSIRNWIDFVQNDPIEVVEPNWTHFYLVQYLHWLKMCHFEKSLLGSHLNYPTTTSYNLYVMIGHGQWESVFIQHSSEVLHFEIEQLDWGNKDSFQKCINFNIWILIMYSHTTKSGFKETTSTSKTLMTNPSSPMNLTCKTAGPYSKRWTVNNQNTVL